jgi:asparagine synthase (glutamine-hydrolysing)
MCGIVGSAGFFEPGLVKRMCDTIAHRGPDSSGIFELPSAAMALGIRRLAVIDLVTGDQPLSSADGKVVIVFNGEIYNFRELREELCKIGHRFHTNSDTEVVLEAYLEWGIEAWTQLQGMFAVAIVDQSGTQPRLILARDRVGIKPLYYVVVGGALVFASELKALLNWSNFPKAIDIGGIRDYLALRYVPGPRSLFSHVSKLPAAHTLEFANGVVSVRRWWTPPGFEFVRPGLDEESAAELIGSALQVAVRRHLISDVPIGVFLSGGIDSSVIAALMARYMSIPIKTFSVRFPDFPSDDAARAATTAKFLGADHHDIECRRADVKDFPEIVWSLDEPVGDAIVLPMFVLAREARRHVKVVLSGEGADEIFGGYMFHRNLVQLDRLRAMLPPAVWPLVAAVIRRLPSRLLNAFFEYPGELGNAGRCKVADMLENLPHSDVIDLYRRAIALFDENDLRMISQTPIAGAAAVSNSACTRSEKPGETTLQRLLRAQFRDWLPDDILMKADKMTMAHSLELRVPFLDEAVMLAAAALPDGTKIGRRSNKVALREFARSLVPRQIVDAPKQAFYFPLEAYINDPVMSDLVRQTLDPARIRRRGLFRQDWIRATAAAPGNAGFLPLKRLFAVVMLELWFERFAPEATWA